MLLPASERTNITVSAVPRHPLDIKPSGNAFCSSTTTTTCSTKIAAAPAVASAPQPPAIDLRSALGHFSRLDDDLINLILEQVDAPALVHVGATCKAFYALSRVEDLWKTLVVRDGLDDRTAWLRTWRNTYLRLPLERTSAVSCAGFFSDLLYRPFRCAHVDVAPYAGPVGRAAAGTTAAGVVVGVSNRIERLGDLTPEDFSRRWFDRPFILTDPVKTWPVYENWDMEILLGMYGDVVFRAEAVDWPLRMYAQYMNDNQDESPLYLFDRGFVEKMALRVDGHAGEHDDDDDGDDVAVDYFPPSCFGEDLFDVLEDQRPDSKWLIVGPARSGSTFHKDPNATSAWNAVIKGAKYWIMFPCSDTAGPPPGVFFSADQSEVTSPLSIAEWLLGFHAEARRANGCLEGICYEGEVLHVPSGWWHLVVNLSPSIAITQNFVPRAHLADVLLFLRDKPDQVSGFGNDAKNSYELFVQKMRSRHPQLLEEALAKIDGNSEGKKRKWDSVTGTDEARSATGNGMFSFDFVDDDLERS
ncbi:MAG: hypothetical protein M1815_002428 [Lichina confinis]|nr:MAG: hypothetical protein M1815_002428 [Lichina confinis]